MPLSDVFSFLGVDGDDTAPITAELGRNISRIIADGDASTDTYDVSAVLTAMAYALRAIELSVVHINGVLATVIERR